MTTRRNYLTRNRNTVLQNLPRLSDRLDLPALHLAVLGPAPDDGRLRIGDPMYLHPPCPDLLHHLRHHPHPIRTGHSLHSLRDNSHAVLPAKKKIGHGQELQVYICGRKRSKNRQKFVLSTILLMVFYKHLFA